MRTITLKTVSLAILLACGTANGQSSTPTTNDLVAAILCRSTLPEIGTLPFLRQISSEVHDEETGEYTITYTTTTPVSFLGLTLKKVINQTFEAEDDYSFLVGGGSSARAVAETLAKHFNQDTASLRVSPNQKEVTVFPLGNQGPNTKDKISVSQTSEGVMLHGTGKCDAINIRARLSQARKSVRK